jgi:hypothetical protein
VTHPGISNQPVRAPHETPAYKTSAPRQQYGGNFLTHLHLTQREREREREREKFYFNQVIFLKFTSYICDTIALLVIQESL